LEAPEINGEEHTSVAKGADQGSKKDDEVQEVVSEDSGAGGDPDDDRRGF
jgi:hypothetical protein